MALTRASQRGFCMSFSNWRNKSIFIYSTRSYCKNTNIPRPKNYWKDATNQKQFLVCFAEEMNIQKPSDWYMIKWKDMREKGGSGMLREFASLHEMITTHFPTISVDPFAFSWKPRGFWDKKENQRLRLDTLAKEHKLETEEDWHERGYMIVRKHASSLLRRFPSYVELLQTVYPQREWKKTRKGAPKGYWENVANQRAQLDKIKQLKGIDTCSDWKNISTGEFKRLEGGSSILQLYASYFEMLQTIYPEHDWNIFTDFPRVSRNFWSIEANQTAFFKKLADDLQCRTVEDWLAIPGPILKKKGAGPLLQKFGSLPNLLMKFFPDYDWGSVEWATQSTRIPTHYFASLYNQRAYMDSIGSKLGITKLSQWNDISHEQLLKEKGGQAILRLYPSLFSLLQTVYPEVDWHIKNRKVSPRLYWEDLDKQREFFDEFALQNNLLKPSDWATIRYDDIAKGSGTTILKRYSSLYEALQCIYPEKEWDIASVRTRVPNNYWDNINNIRSFLTQLKEKHNIQTDDEWARISIEQVKQENGRTLIAKYGSLFHVLKLVYPKKKWKKSAFQNRNKRSAQRWMFQQVKKLFPQEEVIEEFLHEDLSRISGRAVELDTFIPSLQLGFEYQGEHHYEECPALGPLDMYQKRDVEKLTLCNENDIDIVFVPYWWDRKEESLKELIHEVKSTTFRPT